MASLAEIRPFPHSGDRAPVDVVDRLERVRLSGDFTLDGWCALLGATRRQYLRFVERRASIPAESLEFVAEFLEFDLQTLLEGNFDFRGFALNMGCEERLPERYERAAFSRMRTVISVLDGVEDLRGWRARIALMRKFGLTERHLSDPSLDVSLHLITDICREIRGSAPGGWDDLFQLGAYSVVSNRESSLASELRSMGEPKGIYERILTDLVPYYERNCAYEVRRISETRAAVDVRPRKEVADAMGIPRIGSRDTCTIKASIMASATAYAGLPFAEVVETHCVHEGHPTCRFEIDYEGARHRFQICGA